MLLILCTSLVLLPGCASTGTEVKVSEVPRVPLDLPNVDPLTLDNVQWIVITEQNAKEQFDLIKKKEGKVVLFTLTTDGYETLAVNQAKIMALVRQQKAVIVAYEKYYLPGSADAPVKKDEAPKEEKPWWKLW